LREVVVVAFITVRSNERHAFGAFLYTSWPSGILAPPLGKNRKNRFKMSQSLNSRPDWHGIQWVRGVHDDDERKPNAKCSQPTARRQWAGNSSSIGKTKIHS
jgi:hypothetical protein